MDYRQLGNSGLEVSALGFGCGAVGGLLVRGDRTEMLRAVARALELGINYFDTAPLYGNGQSETNLGTVLAELGVDAIVGTKVRLTEADLDNIESAITQSVEQSLLRLRRETLDLIQLHNSITVQRQSGRDWVTVAAVERASQTFEKLVAMGKVRHWGITGLGETAAIQQALGSGAESVQSCFNLLNPSAGRSVSANFPFQDYARLIDKAAAKGMGVIAIRVLAAGALSGTTERHPNAAQSVAPIASSPEFGEDVRRAQALNFLIKEGYAETLAEAAIRFVIGKPEVSTTLVGISNLEQLEFAVKAANKGAFPSHTLERLEEVWEDTK